MSLLDDALKLLEVKSKKAIEIAKGQMISTKVESETLRKALEYYAQNLDDSLHPGILALACESIGKCNEEPIPMQVAMLFLTAAVDIHDDVIDESMIKNGRATVFGKFGKDVALLVGDGMMLKGMTLLCSLEEVLPRDRRDAVIATIQNTFFEAGDAHIMELSFRERTSINPEKYYKILNKKAAILECHTRVGAIVGGASPPQIEALGTYGRIIGLLITLRDEFIDVFEPDELINRIEKGYPPLPILYSLKSPETGHCIKDMLSRPKLIEKKIDTMVDAVFTNSKVKTLKGKMEQLVKKALQNIKNIPEGKPLELIALSALEG
ncbi:MAG: polyprenyl synthetase family protein, partial [Candidatus Bathyarchaeia archaeon]